MCRSSLYVSYFMLLGAVCIAFCFIVAGVLLQQNLEPVGNVSVQLQLDRGPSACILPKLLALVLRYVFVPDAT